LSILKYLVLGALAVAALALRPGTAEAALENQTQSWCKQKGTADQILVDGGFASLIFKADGDLVLQPENHLVNKIWSSGTAGTGAKACFQPSGTLAVFDAAGTKIWSKSGGAVPDPGFGTYPYQISLSLSQCTLSAKYKVFAPATWPPSPFGAWSPTVVWARGTLWSQPVACPVVSQSVVGDDWCLDTTAERTIVQSSWSKLLWKPSGALALVGTGLREGQQLWATPAAGAGAKVCFEPTGRLAIFNSQDQAIWSTTPDTTTTRSHLLSLDGCSLDAKPADGSGPMWTDARRCPQTTMTSNVTVNAGPSDVVLLENAQARLTFQTDGNLVLRAANGDEVWHSALAPNRGKRLAFQTDGNLVIYDAASAPAWGAKMAGRGIALLELDGCSVSLKTWSETRWTRGFQACPGATLANTPAWELAASGSLTVLRTPESRLVWQGDGNLVLYTASGAPVWASNTGGNLGKGLYFQPDGNLVVYKTLDTMAASEALWSSGTWYTAGADHALRLGEHCKLTITDRSGGAVKWTGSDSCTVVNYTFERGEGGGLFGAGMRTHLTAKDDGTARLDSTTSVDATIFGSRIELLSAAGYQTEGDSGADGNNFALTVFGESAASVNVGYEKTFFERSRTFTVGLVPVFVSAGATGELGLSLSFSGGTLALTPSAGLYATVAAGVGGECDVGGASAGVRGTLTLLEVGLPISLKLYVENGQPKYTIQGDLTIATLSGKLELYAEAYVKICWWKVSADWSTTLFSWTGAEWTQSLFSKSGTF
jgi:hypothetical protein